MKSPPPSRRGMFAVLALIALSLLLLNSRKPKPAGAAMHAPEQQSKQSISGAPPVQAASPQPMPEDVKASPPAAAADRDGFVQGMFPGISVRTVPGATPAAVPEGTPRTVPEQKEIVLPDGRRLIGVTLDETWRVPLKAKENP